ncbi:hypothetical protein CYMTET_35104 [Cymbomonas tetramitiformis]|uniref:Pseudouridine synthase RsuA/RluA-like domain-containing protein n=1 Tax=Cymbomonas tetramitiformis TaxID=36881 RepID=A0AAE0FAA7_9CHLO|nr:hypothetical protein CYMTET_35104 [Cymbomonas tetramitiformis]
MRVRPRKRLPPKKRGAEQMAREEQAGRKGRKNRLGVVGMAAERPEEQARLVGMAMKGRTTGWADGVWQPERPKNRLGGRYGSRKGRKNRLGGWAWQPGKAGRIGRAGKHGSWKGRKNSWAWGMIQRERPEEQAGRGGGMAWKAGRTGWAELQPALTYFDKLGTFYHDGAQGFALLRAEIKTGRTHQIRRHLDGMQYQILGDTKYGKTRINAWQAAEYSMPRMVLHAALLDMKHPVSGERIKISAPIPNELRTYFLRLPCWVPSSDVVGELLGIEELGLVPCEPPSECKSVPKDCGDTENPTKATSENRQPDVTRIDVTVSQHEEWKLAPLDCVCLIV